MTPWRTEAGRRARRAVVLSTALVGLIGGPAPATSSAAGAWSGQPTYLSGTSRYDGGEWIHTDFVYDDYGADTVPYGQLNVARLAPTDGDARYPESDPSLSNTADIVEVRARVAGDDLEVRVTLQTIVDPAVTALWVMAGEVERIVTATDGEVDADANTVSFTLPDAAAGGTLSLAVGAGLHDGTGALRSGQPGMASSSPDEITTGGPTDNRLFDLAFNTRDLEGRGGAWNETVQSAALAAGELGPFGQTIDIDALRDGVTTPPPSSPGYYVRVFASHQDLGEGMAGDFPEFLGRWQPYALWLPDAYDPTVPNPLLLNLHSLDVHHNQYRGGTSPTYGSFYEQTGDALDAVVVTPLARGPDGWYEDEGLVDTLEVWADVARNYAIDPERTSVAGYSMGGYGTYRLATLIPDSFASAVSVVGPPANGIWAYPLPPSGGADNPDNTYPQLENTLHVPVWITHGVQDELVPFLGVQHQADRFAALGHEHRFALHPLADHFSFAVQDDWERETAWLAGHPQRTTDPHRITYWLRPASWATDSAPKIVAQLDTLTTAVGARLDGAYWVSAVDVEGTGDVTGVVDLESGGIAERIIGSTPVRAVGVDGPSPHTLTGLDLQRGTAPTTDTLSGSLVDVSALTVDVGRAGLSDTPTVEIQVVGTVGLTLVRDGVVVANGTISDAGWVPHAPQPAPPPTPDPPPVASSPDPADPGLPATGAAYLPASVLLLAAACFLRRRRATA